MYEIRFPRPDGALYLDDLYIGLKVYRVCVAASLGVIIEDKGVIVAPRLNSVYFKGKNKDVDTSSSNITFKEHSLYEDFNFSQKDKYVFDWILLPHPSLDWVSMKKNKPITMEFASDNNLDPNSRSYNDNYIFSDKFKAKDYAMFINERWNFNRENSYGY